MWERVEILIEILVKIFIVLKILQKRIITKLTKILIVN